jgi:hypothetical protein
MGDAGEKRMRDKMLKPEFAFTKIQPRQLETQSASYLKNIKRMSQQPEP